MFAISRVAMLTAAILVLAACFNVRAVPEPVATSLTVRNRSSFDVDVFAIPVQSAPPTRLGTVLSNSAAIFSLHTHDLQPGGFLGVEVHAIGARGSWISDVVPVSSQEIAVLDVHADPFGDCSTSTLYTVWKPDSTGAATAGAR